MKEPHARFWSKVEIGDWRDCWEWRASKYGVGYGQFSLGREEGNTGAHRHAYALTYGEVPDGLCVLHRCDNRSCCNPYHLRLGTKKDNSQDMVRKGRNRPWGRKPFTSTE